MAWRTIAITEGVRLDDNANISRTRIIRYMVDEQGPFQIEVPADTSEGEIRQRIDEQARMIESLARGQG